MINLVACYLNVYAGMERKIIRLRCQARCRSGCGVVMISTVKLISVSSSPAVSTRRIVEFNIRVIKRYGSEE